MGSLPKLENSAQLEYEFVRSYPRSITSMPVTYDGSSLLKCSVQMTYMRYVVDHLEQYLLIDQVFNPFQQAHLIVCGILAIQQVI